MRRRGRTRGRCFFFFQGGGGGGRDWKYGYWKDAIGVCVDAWARLFSDRFFWVGGGSASVNSSWHLTRRGRSLVCFVGLVFNLGWQVRWRRERNVNENFTFLNYNLFCVSSFHQLSKGFSGPYLR